jgi:hypothetical protein
MAHEISALIIFLAADLLTVSQQIPRYSEAGSNRIEQI